jgi:hypothetical protein
MEGERLWPTLRLLMLPALVAVLAAAAWFYLRVPWHLDIGEADSGSWLSLSDNTMMFHSLLAAFTVSAVVGGHMLARRLKNQGKRQEFLEVLCERIPLALKMLLAVFSVVVMTIVAQEHFVTVRAGLSKVSCIAFILGVYWEVVTKLDNPVNYLWSDDWVGDFHKPNDQPTM